MHKGNRIKGKGFSLYLSASLSAIGLSCGGYRVLAAILLRVCLVFISYIFLWGWLQRGWPGDAGGCDCGATTARVVFCVPQRRRARCAYNPKARAIRARMKGLHEDVTACRAKLCVSGALLVGAVRLLYVGPPVAVLRHGVLSCGMYCGACVPT